MVPRFTPAGRSFKGLAQYLCHDPKAETTSRVAWIHSLNCAHDHVPSVVNEMIATWHDAALLKQEAGIRQGGRPLTAPVKHFSLNWHPSETPTRAQMIAATQSFLEHMKWQDHQCLLVAHSDKPFAHVHGMVNVVHPETGRKLDDSLERRRAQAWAKAWEQEHGIFCEQRFKPAAERAPSPPRWLWEELKEFDAHQHGTEAAQRAAVHPEPAGSPRRDQAGEEWTTLKTIQRAEREAFHAAGKQAYGDLRRAAYREVREGFRDEWGDYYAAKRTGAADIDLDARREDILARQKAAVTGRRETACAALREERDEIYAELLADQRGARQRLRERQARGLASLDLLDRARERAAAQRQAANQNERDAPAAVDIGNGVGDASRLPDGAGEPTHGPERGPSPQPSGNGPRVRDGADIASGLGLGAMGGLASFSERLFEGLFGTAPPRRPAPAPQHHRRGPDPAATAVEAARRTAEEEAEERRRQAWWDDRERSRD